MVQLTTPCDEALVRSLKVGDAVEISGTLFTGRDAVHKYLHEGGQLPAGVNLTAVAHLPFREGHLVDLRFGGTGPDKGSPNSLW